MIVDKDQIKQFRSNGFMSISHFVDDDALNALRAAYDEMIEFGTTSDASSDRRLGGVTRQIMRPESSHATFRNNAARAAALEVAGTLTGWQEPGFYYSQLLYKPPGHAHATPWHQDEAYGAMPFVPPGARQSSFMVSFWVALDNVDADNGCMHFYPLSHSDQLLAHRVVAGDAGDEERMLGLEDDEWMDPSQVVCCPLAAGGATVHDAGTLHFTPPNHSNRARRAYIISIAKRSFLRSLQASKPIPKSGSRIIRNALATLRGRRD